mgnify:CR=1 FL=1
MLLVSNEGSHALLTDAVYDHIEREQHDKQEDGGLDGVGQDVRTGEVSQPQSPISISSGPSVPALCPRNTVQRRT